MDPALTPFVTALATPSSITSALDLSYSRSIFASSVATWFVRGKG
jgi:hypothetical protein